MAPPFDPRNGLVREFSPSLADIMRRRSAESQEPNQIAAQMLPPTVAQRMEPITRRLTGLQSGIEDVANYAYEGSLPAHLRNMYQQLQAGAAPEELAGQGFDAALRMLGYGIAMPGGELDANTLAALRMRRKTVMPGEKLGNYFGGTRHHLINDSGNIAGFVDVSEIAAGSGKGKYYDPTKKGLYIHMIGKDEQAPFAGGHGSYNQVGMDEIRSMLPEIAREFPEVEQVGGFRVGGARSGHAETVWVPLSRIRALLAKDKT